MFAFTSLLTVPISILSPRLGYSSQETSNLSFTFRYSNGSSVSPFKFEMNTGNTSTDKTPPTPQLLPIPFSHLPSFAHLDLVSSEPSSGSLWSLWSKDRQHAPPYDSETNILVWDHVNINHPKGNHPILTTFFRDLLGLALDPRKEENYKSGTDTLWFNAGMSQIHSPEGDRAQRFPGVAAVIAYTHDAFQKVIDRLESAKKFSSSRVDENDPVQKLIRYNVNQGGQFHYNIIKSIQIHDLHTWVDVVCPFGNHYTLVETPSKGAACDYRGKQPADLLSGNYGIPLGFISSIVYVDHEINLEAIERFYNMVLGARNTRIVDGDNSLVVGSAGGFQALVFSKMRKGKTHPPHDGVHISLYVNDIESTFRKAEDLGLVYVNPRFKRCAKTLEECFKEAMFRVLNIVDPLDLERKVLCQLEHEIRSTQRGSCPLNEKYRSHPST